MKHNPDCGRCQERGKDWPGPDPRCAFRTGVFVTDNWNCATLNQLRAIVEDTGKRIWHEDQNAALIPFDRHGQYLLLSWYKHRGRTEGAWVVHEDSIGPLTLHTADTILKAAGS